jgi:hypothetical protein
LGTRASDCFTASVLAGIIEIAAESARSIRQILRAARYRLFDADAPENEFE